MGFETLIKGKANQGPIAPTAESGEAIPRTNRYNELIVDDRVRLTTVMEGSYFKALNPTFGTGIAMTIQTSWVATNALMIMRNTAGGAGTSIIPDFIRLTVAVAGVTTTRSEFGIILDTVNRFSSGGTPLTITQPNLHRSDSSLAIINFGAVTATAATAPRQVARGSIKPVTATNCFALGDSFIFDFSGRMGSGMAQPIAAISGVQTIIPITPVIIAGGGSMLLHVWNIANATTAPSWEVEVGFIERQIA